ncbi:MAG: hypothetical protein AAF745_15775 [Planctomycetota bacterium]
MSILIRCSSVLILICLFAQNLVGQDLLNNANANPLTTTNDTTADMRSYMPQMGALPPARIDVGDANQRIYSTLDRKVAFDFDETPLSAVVRAIAKEMKIPVIDDLA